MNHWERHRSERAAPERTMSIADEPAVPVTADEAPARRNGDAAAPPVPPSAPREAPSAPREARPAPRAAPVVWSQPSRKLGEELPVFCERCGYQLFGLSPLRCDRCDILHFHCPE